MKFTFALAALALAAPALAQSSSAVPSGIAGISPCILTCLTSAQGCSSFTDIQCVCTSTQYQDSAASCLNSTCSTADQNAARQLQQSQCASSTFLLRRLRLVHRLGRVLHALLALLRRLVCPLVALLRRVVRQVLALVARVVRDVRGLVRAVQPEQRRVERPQHVRERRAEGVGRHGRGRVGHGRRGRSRCACGRRARGLSALMLMSGASVVRG
ncbi:hypothetical protein FA95DRAFT_205877 [Auriscalpium vulgare]|uniref:Uncharacterized protein n=1 Tax=Auriscalpium vulgare TaxID=40419 RepID=A0ACB8RMJ6_9AGAM|nr:hypothetical protein FA95DRAFT_205877 [Auriscalpium vulgare]